LRLFTAIDLDDGARDAVARLQRRLAERLGGDQSLKWVDPSRMHLTLVFLGEVADARVPAIVEILSSPIDAPRFAIAFQGLGVFPPRGAPRVLWLDVAQGGAALATVHGHVVKRLASLGVALEDGAFRPHLTLARWRDSRPSDRARALAGGVSEPIAVLGVDSIALYQSRLSSAGPTYTALARATLT
jgi:2'-5' RNA ligase